jgi:hypothetical protein
MITERLWAQILKTTSTEKYPGRAKSRDVSRQSLTRYRGRQNVERPRCCAVWALVISLCEPVSC